MPLVKFLINYDNADGWKKDDVVDVTNPWMLIQEGKCILVDKEGNEIPPMGKIGSCPVCPFTTAYPIDLANHILTHKKTEKTVVAEATVPETIETVSTTETTEPKKTPEELTAMRLENLKKAREAAKAKKEAEVSESLSEL